MAAIPCIDFVTDPVEPVPARITCTERTCLQNRFALFVASMDLSPELHEKSLGAGVLAWSLWDIPGLHASQIDDDAGEDLICISVEDRVYWLDYTRHKDEWNWNAFAPIRRMVRFGPIPSNAEACTRGGYDLEKVKRFREFLFNLKDGATGAPGAFWEISVGEWTREQNTTRTTTRRTTNRMRTRISTKGSQGFVVTVRHSADEPVEINNWSAEWDVLGKRIRQAGRA